MLTVLEAGLIFGNIASVLSLMNKVRGKACLGVSTLLAQPGGVRDPGRVGREHGLGGRGMAVLTPVLGEPDHCGCGAESWKHLWHLHDLFSWCLFLDLPGVPDAAAQPV